MSLSFLSKRIRIRIIDFSKIRTFKILTFDEIIDAIP
jgi:hypothetical protein